MSQYKPTSRARDILAYLDIGPATRSELGRLLRAPTPKRRRRMIHGLLKALQLQGLVFRSGDAFAITSAGQEALTELRMGLTVDSEPPAPSVRVFRDAA